MLFGCTNTGPAIASAMIRETVRSTRCLVLEIAQLAETGSVVLPNDIKRRGQPSR